MSPAVSLHLGPRAYTPCPACRQDVIRVTTMNDEPALVVPDARGVLLLIEAPKDLGWHLVRVAEPSEPGRSALRLPRLFGVSTVIKLALSLFLAGSPVPSPNIVLVILDDVGVDRIGVYGDPLAHTPTMDALAAAGAWFLDAYSETVCSPSRLAMVSGTYPSRYGISNAIAYSGTDPASVPPLSIPTIARQLPAHYRREAIGKWHLANKSVGMVQPLLFGFDSHTGTIASPGNYTSWNWWHNGSFLLKLTDYLTTWNTDQAATSLMLWGDDHLFLWLAYQAPHKPFHAPPAHLHTYDLPPAVEDDPRLHFRAALEAFDTELGRLLDGLSPAVAGRTYVFVIGDNGTPVEAIDDGLQPEQSKGFVYEGGIHVPLIVAGPGNPSRVAARARPRGRHRADGGRARRRGSVGLPGRPELPRRPLRGHPVDAARDRLLAPDLAQRAERRGGVPWRDVQARPRQRGRDAGDVRSRDRPGRDGRPRRAPVAVASGPRDRLLTTALRDRQPMISDEELLTWAVRFVPNTCDMPLQRWACVGALFGLGSTVAVDLCCRRFNFDPDEEIDPSATQPCEILDMIPPERLRMTPRASTRRPSMFVTTDAASAAETVFSFMRAFDPHDHEAFLEAVIRRLREELERDRR